METLTMISKLDLAKSDKNYYHAGLRPEVKDYDSYYYLSIEGKGSPDNEPFLQAMEALYGTAYGIKFLCKGEDNDFVVPKMECYWFIAGGQEVQHKFAEAAKSEWCWKIVIRMPDFVESHHFFQAAGQLTNKKPELSAVIDNLKFELINEGKCAQILHIGSWDREEQSIEKLHGFIRKEGLKIIGYHKEIYISNPRRVEESKKKTILRYQVK